MRLCPLSWRFSPPMRAVVSSGAARGSGSGGSAARAAGATTLIWASGVPCGVGAEAGAGGTVAGGTAGGDEALAVPAASLDGAGVDPLGGGASAPRSRGCAGWASAPAEQHAIDSPMGSRIRQARWEADLSNRVGDMGDTPTGSGPSRPGHGSWRHLHLAQAVPSPGRSRLDGRRSTRSRKSHAPARARGELWPGREVRS
jgi:hypothetical protein